MTDFENLKNSYVSAIQYGLIARANHHEARRGNELLHQFCEHLVDNSNYGEADKAAMKQELELIKEALAKEIEYHYKQGV